MGLHTGEPALGDEGYLGLDVVRAARICTAARGGTVLLSESTRALIGATLPDGVAVFPRGERHLKDIDEPERVYELDIEGVAPAEPLARRAAPGAADARARTARRLRRAPRTRTSRSESKASANGSRPRSSDMSPRSSRRSWPGERRPRVDRDDAGIDEIAARAESLGEQIQARVNAMLAAKGITTDRPDE